MIMDATVHRSPGPINRLVASLLVCADRGERSSRQFRGDMWSARRVRSRCWVSRTRQPLLIRQ